MTRAKLAALVVLGLLLAGCGGRIGLSGAAALRVEVEVYKGPVGQSPEIQAGELAAQLVEAARDTDNWARSAQAVYVRQRCSLYQMPGGGMPLAASTSADCIPLRQAIEHAREIVGALCDMHPYWIDKAIGETGTSGTVGDAAKVRDLCRSYDPTALTAGQIPPRPGLAQPARQPGNLTTWGTTIVTTTTADADPKDNAKSKTVFIERKIVVPADAPAGRTVESVEVKRSGGTPETVVETRKSLNQFGGLTPDQYFCGSILPGQPTVLAGTRYFTPTCSDGLRASMPEFSRRISIVAALMRSKATTVAEANLARQPGDRNVRLLLNEFSYITGNAAARIGAGITVLQKVYEEQDYDRSRNLPVGDYLRGASQSGFLQAFKWFDAALDRPANTSILKLDDRMRAMDALTGDYYWQKVNEVFASGQGDVSMALIKDELGNWNLKNFSNEPGKLLAAYRGGVNALIATGVKLATKTSGAGAVGLTGGRKILGLADQLARGGDPDAPALAGLDIETLHARTLSRLAAAERRFDVASKALAGQHDVVKAAADTAADGYAKANGALTEAVQTEKTAHDQLIGCTTDTCAARQAAWSSARDTLAKAQIAEQLALERRTNANGDLEAIDAQTKGLPGQAAAAAEQVLADHAADLVALQGSIAGPEPAAKPAPR